MNADDDRHQYSYLELDLEGPPSKPVAPAKPAAPAERSFRDLEGPISVHNGLALRGAADSLPRNVIVPAAQSTEDPAERAVLRILGIEDKGKRVKGKGEKKLDVSGLVGAGERILESAIRRRWDKAPTIHETANQIAAQIGSEQRATLPQPCNKLYLGKDGGLYLNGHAPTEAGNRPHRISPVAYSQIAERAPMPRPLGYNLNAWCPQSDRSVRARRLVQAGEDRPLIFAAVGPRYVEFDADRVVGALAGRLPDTAKARWTYGGDGGTWKIEATMARPEEVDGDLHELGIWLRSSDDGRNGIAFGFCATRWTCSNTLRILHSATAKTMRHVGSIERFVERFEDILQMADDAWQVFEAAWRRSSDSHPVDEHGKAISVEEAVVRLCAARATAKHRLNVPGVPDEQLAGRIMTSWQAEPDDTIQGLVNAVTRAAHEWQWKPSSWAEDDLEEQAGQLLYARVIELPTPAVEA